jgi:hypothetical protein
MLRPSVRKEVSPPFRRISSKRELRGVVFAEP